LTILDALIDLKKITESTAQTDLIFVYRGVVNNEIVKEMLHLTESALEAETIKNSVKRKIFRVLTEAIQNSYKHQCELVLSDDKMKIITMAFAKRTSYFELILGNYIIKEKAASLKVKMDRINGQNEKELKLSYRETLNNNSRTKAGGSGLGLMDIARKTGEPLNYNFTKVNDDVSYFTLNVKINMDE
jgi:hypothetical protein